MSEKADAAKIAIARRLWAQGYMRKFIENETGLSGRTITRYCRDLPKPYEHRGMKKKRWSAAMTRSEES